MPDIYSLRPQTHQRVMDLVAQAGIDVSDWKNLKKGVNEAGAASNPRYCYEWAFEKKDELVVLNLWFDGLKAHGTEIVQSLNMREIQRQFSKKSDVRIARADRMDKAIMLAWDQCLPIRVVIGDGRIFDPDKENDKASKVSKRLLDPVPWAVTSYDRKTGQCQITRGAKPFPSGYADQFLSQPERIGVGGRGEAVSQPFNRDSGVRARVLHRAAGKCEFCSAPGFRMEDGRVYLESHHVIPLSEGGDDRESNVVALCANHHREAHFGGRREEIRERLLDVLAGIFREGKERSVL